MDIGKKIKELRKQNGLSQSELAEKCNLSKNAIWNYENNKRTPTISTLLNIADKLDIQASDLIESTNGINVLSNQLEIVNAINNDINNTINKKDEEINKYNSNMNELYSLYFFKLFNWKTLKMSSKEYFKFVLSLSQLDEIHYLTEQDLEELSTLFSRLLSLKFHERSSLNQTEKILPGHSDRYEKNNFLIKNDKK